MFLQQPVHRNEQIPDPYLLPGTVHVALAISEALAMILEHLIRQAEELVHCFDDGLCVSLIGVCEIRQPHQEGNASPEVTRYRRLWANPSVFGLKTQDSFCHIMNLALESRIVELIGQRHESVEPVRQRFIQRAVVPRPVHGRLQPWRTDDIIIEITQVAKGTRGDCFGFIQQPTFRFDGTKR